jgi:hypothetical protein
MKSKSKPAFKLKIEMVPLSSWGKSLRNSIPQSKWDKLRKAIHEKNGLKCEICGSSNKLNCHEHWEFDEGTNTQRLMGLGTVCNMCHHVAHIGRSKQLAAQGHLNLEAVIDHFLKVNGVDLETFVKHEDEARKLFVERSAIQWNIDFGLYSEFLPKNAG